MSQTLAQTEQQFTDAVIEYAQLRGYLVAHFRPARTDKGWVTAVQGDGAGYVDLTLVHPKTGRVIAAELKLEKGRLTTNQNRWADAWRMAEMVNPNVHHRVYRPNEWRRIEQDFK